MSVGRKADILLLTVDQRLHFASGFEDGGKKRGGRFSSMSSAVINKIGLVCYLLFRFFAGVGFVPVNSQVL